MMTVRIFLCRWIALRCRLRGNANRLHLQRGDSRRCQLGCVLPPTSGHPSTRLRIPSAHRPANIRRHGCVLAFLRSPDPLRDQPDVHPAGPVWCINVRYAAVHPLRGRCVAWAETSPAGVCGKTRPVSWWRGTVLYSWAAFCATAGIPLSWPILPRFWGVYQSIRNFQSSLSI